MPNSDGTTHGGGVSRELRQRGGAARRRDDLELIAPCQT